MDDATLKALEMFRLNGSAWQIGAIRAYPLLALRRSAQEGDSLSGSCDETWYYLPVSEVLSAVPGTRMSFNQAGRVCIHSSWDYNNASAGSEGSVAYDAGPLELVVLWDRHQAADVCIFNFSSQKAGPAGDHSFYCRSQEYVQMEKNIAAMLDLH